MHENKIAEYRAEAVICIARANSDPNKSTSARWLNVAADWTRMAEDLEAKIHPPRPNLTRDGGN